MGASSGSSCQTHGGIFMTFRRIHARLRYAHVPLTKTAGHGYCGSSCWLPAHQYRGDAPPGTNPRTTWAVTRR